MKTRKARKDGLRAYTAEECRVRFQQHMLSLCEYWSKVDRSNHPTEQDRMEGLCHSIQAYLDGRTLASPAIDLVLCPHKTDKAYHIEHGENWHEKGLIINDCSLTETFYQAKKAMKK